MHIIDRIFKNLNDGEKIEITRNGNIYLLRPGIKKYQKTLIGNLSKHFDLEPLPLKSKPWISINTPAFEKYRDFGRKEIPVKKTKSYDTQFVTGIFLSYLNSKETKIILGYFVDSDGMKYTTKEIDKIGIKGFFGATGKLRIIECDGMRYYIPDINSYDTNTKIFKDKNKNKK